MKLILFLEDSEPIERLPHFVKCVEEGWDKRDGVRIYLVTTSGRAWQTAYVLGIDGIIESPGPYTFEWLLHQINEAGKCQRSGT